ncbi:MAG: DUF4389 domain-containing protein [Dehalococcoidia bacterium]
MTDAVPPVWDVVQLRPPTERGWVQPPPVFDADRPGLQSRLMPFLRPIVFIPHYVVTTALGYVVWFTAIFSWFAIIFTGTLPRGLFGLGAYYLRWSARVWTYMSLISDRYPPFGDAPYPAQFVIQYPERSSRLKAIFRLLLVIPTAIVYGLLSYVGISVVIVAWFAILFTRRYPLGLYLFALGWLRWGLRLQAYLLLLTDHYPPFHLSEIPDPAALFLAGSTTA